MATKVERLNSLPVTERGTYLFFQHPPELWVSDRGGHSSILGQSGREVTSNTIAGGFTYSQRDHIVVFDGSGSGNLGIGRRNATPVVSHTKKLPGFRGMRVDAI